MDIGPPGTPQSCRALGQRLTRDRSASAVKTCGPLSTLWGAQFSGLQISSRYLCDRIFPGGDRSAIRLVPTPEKGEPARDRCEGSDNGDDDPEAARILRQWNAADIHAEQTGNHVDR